MINNSLSFIPSLQSPLKNTQKMPDAHSKSIRHSPRKYKQPNYNSIKANLHHKSSTRQTVHLMYSFLQTRKHLYIKLITFFSIGIQSDFFDRFLNKAQIHNKRFLLVCSVQAGNIPASTTLPGKHHIAGRITAQQFRIVPNGGK